MQRSIHWAQLWAENAVLKPDEHISITSFDFSNAFNTISRSAILHQLQLHFPEVIPIFSTVYGAPITQRYSDGSVAAFSTTGIAQGDPLGTFLFSLAIHPLLVSLSSSTTDSVLFAYADDIQLLSTLDKIDTFTESLETAASSLGLTLNRDKCKTWTPASSEALVIFGSPVGTPAQRATSSSDILTASSADLTLLPPLGIHVALPLVRFCVNTRPLHLLMCTPTSDIHDHINAFDASVDSTLQRCFSDRIPAPPFSWRVLRCARARDGGLAINQLSQIAAHSYPRSAIDGFTTFLHSHPAIVSPILTNVAPRSHLFDLLVSLGKFFQPVVSFNENNGVTLLPGDEHCPYRLPTSAQFNTDNADALASALKASASHLPSTRLCLKSFSHPNSLFIPDRLVPAHLIPSIHPSQFAKAFHQRIFMDIDFSPSIVFSNSSTQLWDALSSFAHIFCNAQVTPLLITFPNMSFSHTGVIVLNSFSQKALEVETSFGQELLFSPILERQFAISSTGKFGTVAHNFFKSPAQFGYYMKDTSPLLTFKHLVLAISLNGVCRD
jgi:hypothetical protein